MQQIVLYPEETQLLELAVRGLTEKFDEACEVVPGTPTEMRNFLRIAGRVPNRMYIGSPAQYHATMRVLGAAEDVLGDEGELIERMSTRLFCEVQNARD